MYTTFLTRIKNAQSARHERLKVPFSNFDMAIAELLTKNGFLKSATRKGRAPKRVIEVYLNTEGRGVAGVQFLSRPSRRIYRRHKELSRMRSTRGGIVVLSTPKGLMRAREAMKEKLGGELLFEVW